MRFREVRLRVCEDPFAECRPLTSCACRDLCQALPPRHLSLRQEGRIQNAQTFSRLLGLRARLRMRPRRRRRRSPPTGPTRTLHQCQPATPLEPIKLLSIINYPSLYQPPRLLPRLPPLPPLLLFLETFCLRLGGFEDGDVLDGRYV